MTGDSLPDFLADVSEKALDYGWIEGSPTFKQAVTSLYKHTQPEQILQTNGATGANLLTLYALIEPLFPCILPISNSMTFPSLLVQRLICGM